MGTVVRLEMHISREEFLRLLPSAVGRFDAEEDTFRPADSAGGWAIRLVRLGDVRLGSLPAPCHRVEIELDGLAEAEREAFMGRFFRAFLRGGG